MAVIYTHSHSDHFAGAGGLVSAADAASIGAALLNMRGRFVMTALAPLAVTLGWVAWRAMRYRLTDTELQVESGVLTTRSRRVPLGPRGWRQ